MPAVVRLSTVASHSWPSSQSHQNFLFEPFVRLAGAKIILIRMPLSRDLRVGEEDRFSLGHGRLLG